MAEQKTETQIKDIAAQILRDPILLSRLGNRVYELMMEDLRIQFDRAQVIHRIF